jgi:hypothetical protein
MFSSASRIGTRRDYNSHFVVGRPGKLPAKRRAPSLLKSQSAHLQRLLWQHTSWHSKSYKKKNALKNAEWR